MEAAAAVQPKGGAEAEQPHSAAEVEETPRHPGRRERRERLELPRHLLGRLGQLPTAGTSGRTPGSRHTPRTDPYHSTARTAPHSRQPRWQRWPM